jgi:hypothetical protein
MRNNPLRGVVREENKRDEALDKFLTLLSAFLLMATLILIYLTDIW